MYDVVVRWDASGCFSRGRLPGEFLSEGPYPPQVEDKNQPVSGDIVLVPFLDDGVSYLVQIIRKLPGYLKGVGPADFTHLVSGPWEVGRYRTCFIGPYPYLFRILDVLDDDDSDDDDRSDSDDSDFSNGAPQSDGTVSTLPLYTLDGGSPDPTSRSPASTFCSSKPHPPAYDTAYQWHSDDSDSGSESPIRGRTRAKGERPARYGLQRDESPVRVYSPSLFNRPLHEDIISAGPCGVVPQPRIEISPDVSPGRRLGSLMADTPAMVDSLSPADVPAKALGQAEKAMFPPLVGIYSSIQLPENSTRSISRHTPQRPPPTQDPIGTPRRAGRIPLLGNQTENISPLPASIPDPSRLSAPRTRALPLIPALDRSIGTAPNGPPCVGSSPYDRKYTAELVADEGEGYALRNSNGRIYRHSPQGPVRPPGLFSPAIDESNRKGRTPPQGTSSLVGQIDLTAQRRILALLKSSKPPQETASRCPQSPSIARTPPPPVSPIIKSPQPRVPAVGKSWVVQYLEDLVELDDESDKNTDFYSQSPKTRFARDFPVNESEVEVYLREDPSPGLDRFLTERRLMSPEPALAPQRRYALHGIELRPCDKDKIGLDARPDSDGEESNDGLFDDFPICEMSIAMGLHSDSRRRGNRRT